MTQSNAAPLPERGKPKLLDQVRYRCRLRHLAFSTEHSLIHDFHRRKKATLALESAV